MRNFFIFTLLSLFVFGCSNPIKKETPPSLSETTLKTIAIKAINGERIYNDSLSGLIDYSLPINSNFNDLKTIRIVTPVNKIFFALLLQYPNPAYNRFAVYDSSLYLILIDKSLNGNIDLKTIYINNQQFIETDESFLTKDIVELNRVSLYKTDSTVTYRFRAYTKFTTSNNQYYQIITEISPNRIKANLTSTKPSIISNKSEIFTYDDNKKNILARTIYSLNLSGNKLPV